MNEDMILTSEEAQRMVERDETIEFVVLPSLIPALVAWLDSQDADLVAGPPMSGDSLRWFVASPRSLRRPS